MTDTEAIQQIIAGTPHLARYIQDVADGVRVKDTSYVFNAVATKARAVRAHGPVSLMEAANQWTPCGRRIASMRSSTPSTRPARR